MGGFEQTDGVMQRILMLLFALAGLAERAAQAPHPVRSRVLMILRIAEPAAQQAVLTNDRAASAAYEGDSVAAALRLAARLRMLACLLISLMPLPQPAERSSGHRLFDVRSMPLYPLAPARVGLDTS